MWYALLYQSILTNNHPESTPYAKPTPEIGPPAGHDEANTGNVYTKNFPTKNSWGKFSWGFPRN